MAGMFICLVIFAGCRPTPDFVGISDIPVYPGSQLTETDEFGAMMGDSFSRMDSYTSQVWNFRASATADELLDFYKSKLPDAEVDQTDPAEYADMDEQELEEEMMSRYSLWIPIGNPRNDEEYSIDIGEGWFSICETLKD